MRLVNNLIFTAVKIDDDAVPFITHHHEQRLSATKIRLERYDLWACATATLSIINMSSGCQEDTPTVCKMFRENVLNGTLMRSVEEVFCLPGNGFAIGLKKLGSNLYVTFSSNSHILYRPACKMQDGRTYRYDVFISYRWINPDLEWVRNQLDPALRNAGLRVCLDVRDFGPGNHKILEMERGGLESRRTLCVISPEYFEEGRMVEFESLSARRRDPAGRNSLLIPLIVRETEIPERFQDLIPITWTDPRHHQGEWKKLLQVLGAPNLDAQPPAPIQAEQNHAVFPETATVVKRGAGRWRWQNKKTRISIYIAAALIILTFSVIAIMQMLSGTGDTIDVNPAANPTASPQPTTIPSPSTTPRLGPSPSAPVGPISTKSPRLQRSPEQYCSPKDRSIGKC